MINLDPQAKREANSRILIQTASISTLGLRERRTAVFWLNHHHSRPSGGGKKEQSQSDIDIINLDPQTEGKENSSILIKTSLISTVRRREK